MQLRESAVKEAASTVFIYAEQTKMPWCFFTGGVGQQTALDCYSDSPKKKLKQRLKPRLIRSLLHLVN